MIAEKLHLFYCSNSNFPNNPSPNCHESKKVVVTFVLCTKKLVSLQVKLLLIVYRAQSTRYMSNIEFIIH